MARDWKLTVRRGPRVERSRHPSLRAALAAAEEVLGSSPALRPRQAFVRTIAVGEQVATRIELRGPGSVWAAPRGGVDVRGDGSAQAYVGWVVKRPVEPDAGETPLDALARALGET